MQDLIYLAIIWSGVFLANYVAHKTRLTSVLYFLAFGAIMVNAGWLPEQSSGFIRGFSELGIILIMFALGFEENTSKFAQSIKRSWGIALFGAVTPFCAAYFSALWFWADTRLALFCGLAMASTTVSLTMVSLKSENLHKTSAATGIMTSAVLDNIASLALVALLIPIAKGDVALTLEGFLLIFSKAVLFFVAVSVLGFWVFPNDIRTGLIRYVPYLREFGLKHVLSLGRGEHATLAILLLALGLGLLAHYFGLHPAVGAYLAGLILKEEYFHFHDHPQTNYYQYTKQIVDNVAFSWIGPVFFVGLGAKLIFDAEIFFSVIDETLVLTLSLIIAQIASAGLAARYIGHFRNDESVMIGLGMLGRAELAFVVMDIAYVQYAIMSTEAFYTLMFTAFWLNVSVPISIKLWKLYFQKAHQSAQA